MGLHVSDTVFDAFIFFCIFCVFLTTVFLLTLPSERRTKNDRPAGASDRESVTVLVLGDIGRSPRMQYHAISIAKNGADVQIIGYAGMQASF